MFRWMIFSDENFRITLFFPPGISGYFSMLQKYQYTAFKDVSRQSIHNYPPTIFSS
jgi:hypothetical protein